jgi:hypothetical protein
MKKWIIEIRISAFLEIHREQIKNQNRMAKNNE